MHFHTKMVLRTSNTYVVPILWIRFSFSKRMRKIRIAFPAINKMLPKLHLLRLNIRE